MLFWIQHRRRHELVSNIFMGSGSISHNIAEQGEAPGQGKTKPEAGEVGLRMGALAVWEFGSIAS